MRNAGLGPWIRKRKVKSGDKAAVIHAGRELGYAAMADRVDRLAGALQARGVAPGDRIAYLGNNHPAFLETLFAAGLAGAVFVPLNTRLAPGEMAYQLTDSGSRLLIHEAGLAASAEQATEGTTVESRLAVGGAVPGIEAYEDAIAAAEPIAQDAPVSLEDPAIILYTSGTTGRPKGAVLSHGNMTWNSINVIVDYDVPTNEVALMIAPMFHVASLGMGALPTLLKGGTLVLQERFEPGEVLAAIERYRITSLSGVPTTFQMLAEHPAFAATDISSLVKLTCGGSAVPSRVSDAFEARALSFSNGYGMTETAPGATALLAEHSRAKAGSSGLPHFFTDVRIVEPGGGVAPAGTDGEIQICGPNVTSGYWNLPEASARTVVDGGWLRSGDIGHLDGEGFLYVSDRLKDMIISGGENIYPAEVETVILELPQVASAAVIGIPDEKWGEVPKAVIELAEGAVLDAEALRTHLDGRLARYKIPRTVEFVGEMPRTASGKIRKSDLRRAPGRQAAESTGAGPR
ncbi:long-chain fatty acid--CoA ligase [Arthrobacter sp. JSM 101049]|uniref:acyl-CoA synthetase n=1 Tax=Arthrobacter sp. JSM 101049 TaxID=929097 RepID=UPI003562507B